MRKSCFIALALLVSFMAVPIIRADESAIRKTLAEYVDVFNQKAAEKVGAYWTENGTHTDRETGERTEGRVAIQADMAKVFSAQSDCKLSATIDRIKFISPDVANVEGETTVVLSDAEPIISTYTAIVVHQGDKWLLDSVEEFPLPQPVSSTAALQELQWLIGEWVDDSGDVKVSTTFRWTANQAFLLRSFDVESKDGVAMTGTQVIGWDPRGQQIRSWSFNSDGSFGESTWTRSGDSWLSKSAQTLASGDVASGTYIVERIDDGAFTMQLIGHEVNGAPQAAGAPVTLVRAPEKPATEATSQKN
ncbi:MAG: SgcJ/EcaC family oxidoreductase [Planctomycetaceae bacterium]|nr:SgcJ/EcaC family oxidoreductase [Planctomycetaceae bacterium]